jgi:type II restriction/modification system DNA methylase subunit YeeA
VDKCESAGDILKLKVLDPAMGSGHFLVEATDFLARKARTCTPPAVAILVAGSRLAGRVAEEEAQRLP